MQEEVQTDELSLSDIFKALLSKIWLLIAVLFIGVILGGAFAYVKYHGVYYYGDTAKYFISVIPTASEDTEDERINIIYKEEHLAAMTDNLKSAKFTYQVMDGLRERLPGVPVSDEESPDFNRIACNAYAAKISNSISFSYDYEKNSNAILMKVSVRNDQEFAKALLKQLKEDVPEFIRRNMILPSVTTLSGESSTAGYKTTCTEMTRTYVHLLNPGQTRSEMIKFGLLFGLAAFVIACAVIILVDRMDNRLRDYEEFSQRYAVPVLGVIPRFEEEKALEEENKKKAEKTEAKK